MLSKHIICVLGDKDSDYTVPIMTSRYVSPVGELILGSWNGSLCLCDWATRDDSARVISRVERSLGAHCLERMTEVIGVASKQLDEYFSGERRSFDVALLMCGSEFQKLVWSALRILPYGRTRSYLDIALTLGRPHAVRAVASAIGMNALSIFVPCHRVIGSNGALTGYAGGIQAKSYLIGFEKM